MTGSEAAPPGCRRSLPTPAPGPSPAPLPGPTRTRAPLRRPLPAFLALLLLPLLAFAPEAPGAVRPASPGVDRAGAVPDPVPNPVQEGRGLFGGAPGLAVEGGDHAFLRLDEPLPPVVSYANAGYQLEVRPAEDGGTEAVIDVDLAPLGDGGAFRAPTPAGKGKDAGGGEGAADRAVEALARRLTAEARTRYEAVSAILGWMVHNVVSEETAALAGEPRRPLGSGGPPAAGTPAAGNSEGGSRSRGTGAAGTAGSGSGAEGGPGSRTGSRGGGDRGGTAGAGSTDGSTDGSTGGSGTRGKGAVAAPGGEVAAGSPAKGEPGAAPSGAGRSGGERSAGAAAGPAPVEAILQRGSGDAGEVARLAVALLRAAGLEARTVPGRVVGVPEIGSPWGPHTWIEVHYPPRGWAFSDPLHYHHYVPATYVRLAPEEPEEGRPDAPGAPAAGPGQPGQAAAIPPAASAAPSTAEAGTPSVTGEAPGGPGAAASRLRLVERRDRRETVDLYPPGAPGITARKADPGQQAGALRVVVSGGGRGSAVLEGEDGRTSKVLVGGESVFVGLEGGAYRLEVYLEGRPPIVRQLRVGERERRAVFLRDPGAEPPGAGAPAAGRSSPPERGRRSRSFP